MKNYRQPGETFYYVCTGDVASGDFVVSGGLHGVAVASGASGDTIEVKRRGVWEIGKETGAAWTQGDKLYWASGAKTFTKDSENDADVGAVAFKAAGSADAAGLVLIL